MNARAVAVLALALFAAAPLSTAAATGPRPATLTVSGDGTVTRAPDRVAVAFRIESVEAQAVRATAENTTVTNALHDALTKLGIAPASIATTSYGISYNPPPPQPDPHQAPRYGYIVERVVTVTVDRVDLAGPIVDAGVGAGVTGVAGVSFQLRDPRTAQRAALTAALADAQDQARTVASAAGVRLVRLVEIAPNGSVSRPVPLLAGAARFAAAAVPTQIEPGDLTAHATVTLRYEVAPR